MTDHGSNVTPLKQAAWDQVKAMREKVEEQGDEYPPPPGACRGQMRTAMRAQGHWA